jgi:hypothetical protein
MRRGAIHTKGNNMNRVLSKILAIGFAIAAGLAVGSLYAEAGGEDNSAALAKALSEASVSLDQGLSASESTGKPISGKFEIQDGALQLSVYTMKGDQFAEIIVDHKSGSIKKSEPITEGDDLKAAKEQGEAMGKAKRSLGEAVANAVKANNGFRATSVEPTLDGGRPAASVILVNGQETKEVTQSLD